MDGDLGGMLRQMMENPQFGNMIQAVKAQMGEGNGTVDPAKMMEKLPEMMTLLGPVLQGMGTGYSGEMAEKDTVAGAEENAAGMQKQEDPAVREHGEGDSVIPLFRPGSREKRNKLLAALKPYLSPARCAMVDRAMSAMQLGEILGTMAPTGKQEG